ncbi:MAG: hypothetical protein FRX48_00368 [Lasallia pustulata]|uniref:Metallo-beta-lactamase domain-containing protein n=1 Tax=Lasallia pustulata TaxID=136370 RepID=A0A5M8Q1P9_9LECA|nr:MAG: hypothetical protein FRX48_00368 [Lasallia pustulata]
MSAGLDLLICTACGTQFSETAGSTKQSCRICDDPRQFIPPSGQQFTTLREMQGGKYENKWEHDSVDKRVWSVHTEPKFAIGQRAFLIQTGKGNVLWDLITYLDDATVEKINSVGGIDAIVISHPHYYTTHLEWAWKFNCPVYLCIEDSKWLERPDVEDVRKMIHGATQTILEGVTAVKTGGHFDGSLVLHWGDKLFIADSLVTTPAALYHVDRLPGTVSYVFMYSPPNMIPLPPDEVLKIWRALRPYEFSTTHGAFMGMDVRDANVKKRILESAKIQIRHEGYHYHQLFEEQWP